MEKIIASPADRATAVAPSPSAKKHKAESFADLLNSSSGAAKKLPNQAASPKPAIPNGPVATANQTTSEIRPGVQGRSSWSTRIAQSAESGTAVSSATHLVTLGVIDEHFPTVSHLLKAHPILQQETWNILSSGVNKGKNFTRIPPGSTVQIDPATGEIRWQQSGRIPRDSEAAPDPVNTSGADRAAMMERDTLAGGQALSPVRKEGIFLGTIDSINPTVSHLLMKHPELKEDIWSLVANSVNRNKPFRHIAEGTEVYLKPGTREITLSAAANTRNPVAERIGSVRPVTVHHNKTVPEETGRPADLTEAVQPFLGKSYKEMNCYELLVEGLRRMDIPYAGKDGLFTKLTRMAGERKLPANAYLNGEGIVEAAGSQVLSKRYADMGNWKQDAEKLFKEMESLLAKGQILSFSTEKRGHTGIVSHKDKQWTFINSGKLDHSVNANSRRRGVGEEILHKEISNWFKLAHNNKETLTVTLGRLEQGEIRTTLKATGSLATRS